MNRGRRRKTNRLKAQSSHGILAWVKSKVSVLMGHRFYNKWIALLTLLSPIVLWLIDWGVGNTSSSSSPSSPSFRGDHNASTYNNNVYENVTILNLKSTKDIEREMSADNGRSTISDVIEPCARLQEDTIPQLLNSSELDFLAYNAFHAWKRMDFSNAVMNARCADKLIKSHFPENGSATKIYIESNVWMNAQRIYPVLIDDAMSKADYDGMYRMAAFLIASTPSYWAYPQAMKDIANLRKTGGRLFFFSPERVCELRKLPKHDLENYLTYLTTRGYLAPYSLNYGHRDIEPVEWGEFFGIGHALPYLEAYRVRSEDNDGNEITSNELYGQWVGLGKYELIDVNAEAARTMGLSESQTPRKPIRLTGTITRRRPQSVTTSGDERIKVPEPSSGMLLIIGLAAIALRRPAAISSKSPYQCVAQS